MLGKRFAMITLCLALAIGCAGAFAGCTASGPQSSSSPSSTAPASSSSSASSSSPSADAQPTGTPIADMYADDPAMQAFFQNFNVEDVEEFISYKDEQDTIGTKSPELIQKAFDALTQIVVTGEDTSGEMITDSMWVVTFRMKDGTLVDFTFDRGKLLLGNTPYNIEDVGDLGWEVRSMELDLGNAPKPDEEPKVYYAIR